MRNDKDIDRLASLARKQGWTVEPEGNHLRFIPPEGRMPSLAKSAPSSVSSKVREAIRSLGSGPFTTKDVRRAMQDQRHGRADT